MQEPFYLVKADEYKVQDGDSLKSLADRAGITWQELAKFNWGTDRPVEINEMLKKKVGCVKKTSDGHNYIFSSKDDPGIIYIPKDYPVQTLSLNQTKKLNVSKTKVFSSVYLQTTDAFGHKIGNVSLTLKSIDGWPDVNITTDGNGVGRKDKVLAGGYRVMDSGKKPGYFLSKTNELADNPQNIKLKYGKFAEAVLHTDYRNSSITRIVILSGNEDELFQRENILKSVYQLPEGHTQVEDENNKVHIEKVYAVDNLALAAGWENGSPDIGKLMRETLKSWLSDKYNEAISKGYFVYLIKPETSEILFYNKDGSIEETFLIKGSIKVIGRAGIYASFEINKEFPFYDMSFQSFSITTDPEPENQNVLIVDIVLESQKSQFINLVNKHAGETELAFYLPSGGIIGAIALLGGTGRLEDYGDNNAVRQSVHKRNLAVLATIRDTYNYYIDKVYLPKLKEVTSEEELKILGPPRVYFQMPIPVGTNNDELTELFDAMKANELKPWSAIADKLDEIFERHSQGDLFLRVKFKYKQAIPNSELERDILKKFASNISKEYNVEFNWDLEKTSDGFRIVTKGKQTIKLTVKGEIPTQEISPNGFPIEASLKTNPADLNETYIVLRIAMLQTELPVGRNAHKLKVEFKDIVPGVSAESSFDSASAEMYTGVNISFKELMQKVQKSESFKNWCQNKYGVNVAEARKTFPGFNRWLTILESCEMGTGIGFTGLKEETALAVISSAHGFFERKSIHIDSTNHLCDFQWNKLMLWEQGDLTKLGWNMDTWDNKYYKDYKDKLPDSLKKSRGDLRAEEKVAIVDLGFYAYEDYRKIVKKKIERLQKER